MQVNNILRNLGNEFYSVRNATTGSFLAAAEAGSKPEISVKPTLMQTIIAACQTGNIAMVNIPVSAPTIRLIIKESK